MNVNNMSAHDQAATIHAADNTTKYMSGGCTAHALKFSLADDVHVIVLTETSLQPQTQHSTSSSYTVIANDA
jgi:hypothetical protein